MLNMSCNSSASQEPRCCKKDAHLTLDGSKLGPVHGAGKAGVGQAHDEASPQGHGQVHLEEQDADDHCHPGDLHHHMHVKSCKWGFMIWTPRPVSRA